GLAGHHMTPVTGAVADAEQDRFVLLARAGQRLRAPRIPVDRILRMLQQIRTGLLREAVRHHTTVATLQTADYHDPDERGPGLARRRRCGGATHGARPCHPGW